MFTPLIKFEPVKPIAHFSGLFPGDVDPKVADFEDQPGELSLGRPFIPR
jgi:hypothetical protein